jgi:hypothetical protein
MVAKGIDVFSYLSNRLCYLVTITRGVAKGTGEWLVAWQQVVGLGTVAKMPPRSLRGPETLHQVQGNCRTEAS